jgi:hypothetical protein
MSEITEFHGKRKPIATLPGQKKSQVKKGMVQVTLTQRANVVSFAVVFIHGCL